MVDAKGGLTMTHPWPDRYDQQSEYVNDLEQRLKILNLKSVPASYIGSTRPTTTQMAGAWSLKEGKTLNVPPYGKTQWYNPVNSQVENLFINLPAFGSDPLGVQTDETTLPATEIIGRFVAQQGDTPLATYTASWTKVYRIISFYWSVRSTQAAIAGTWQIRPNALATAIYSHAASKVDQTPQATFDAAYLATNGWSVGNIPGATSPNPHIFGQGWGTIYFPDTTAQGKSGFFDALWLTNDGSGATEFRYNSGSWHINTLAALTSLVFVPQANFAVGSKVVVWGHHPTT